MVPHIENTPPDVVWYPREINQRDQYLLWLKNQGPEEVKAILKNIPDFDKLISWDIYELKAKGVDLARLLLTRANHTDNTPVSSNTMKVSDTYIANLGKNTAANASIGAGDILPHCVYSAKINGIEGIRLPDPLNTPYRDFTVSRPGFYRIADGKIAYIPIRDDQTIEILGIHDATTVMPDPIHRVYADADAARLEQQKPKSGRWWIAARQLAHLRTNISLGIQGIWRIRQELVAGSNQFMRQYDSVMTNEVSKWKNVFPNIQNLNDPKDQRMFALMVSWLVGKESGYRPRIKASTSSAYGLCQMIQRTRDSMVDTYKEHIDPNTTFYDRDPSDSIRQSTDQLKLGIAYLFSVRNTIQWYTGKPVKIRDIIVGYHTGPGFGYSPDAKEQLDRAMKANSGIAARVKKIAGKNPITHEHYRQASWEYYSEGMPPDLKRFADTEI